MADDQSKSGSVSFTPEIDKRIIEGFLGDRETMLKELARDGFSRRLVLKRAASLGLTEKFIQQCHMNGIDVAVRRCLKCNESFVSMGPHNRICRRCQGKYK